MKRIAPLAVVLAALASTAGAQTHLPIFDRLYQCNYSAPWANESPSGWLIFTNKQAFPNVTYGIEVYQTPSGQDNRKIAFAKWVDLCPAFDPNCLEWDPNRTRAEYTRKDELQCTNTIVRNFGVSITFGNCSNGKTRTCTLL